MRIVETDNFGGDYPADSFLGPIMSLEDCEAIAGLINDLAGDNHPRFWRIVRDDYKLIPGFQP